MKKLIASLLLIGLCTSLIFAQVPEKVRITFKEKYPDVTMVKWYPDNDNYRVVFMDRQNVENVLIINKEGTIVRREVVIDRDYPAGIKEYYVKQFPDDTKFRVFTYNDASGNKFFYVPSKDKVFYFDKEGKFVREERREMREEIREEMKDMRDDKN